MITEPLMAAAREDLKKYWHYEVAEQEMLNCLPAGLPSDARIFLEDVKTLMILAWLRGRTWASECDTTGKQS